MKPTRWHHAGCGSFIVLALLAAAARPASAATTSVTAGACSASVDDATGQYTLAGGPAHWTFTGSIGAALQHCQTHSGADRLGPFQSIAFDWQAEGSESGEIRVYAQRPAALLTMTCHDAQHTPAHPFPTLAPPPHLTTFSYREKVFAPHAFRGEANGTPWLWFDSAGDSAILSPADNYMVSSLVPAGGTPNVDPGIDAAPTTETAATDPAANTPDTVASGFVSQLASVPAGFSHATILAFGDSIHATWKTWGNALTDLTAKHRPASDSDITLKYLGYWTDNGSGYYYNYDPAKGYTGTLLAEADQLRQLGVAIHYMQLDSWWYIKTNLNPAGRAGAVSKNPKLPLGTWNCYGGLTAYVAHKDLFPNGLAAFQKQLGLPLVTHNRWVDVNSPYRQQYNISGVAAIDPAWWTHIINYIHAAGAIGYEQDWMNEIYRNSPAMQSTTTAGNAFTDGMAHATAADGISMQYCMTLPRLYLQGTRYDNLASIRCSDDRFEPQRWENFLYTSQLAAALGEWPFADCFRSNELGNLLLSDLSCGPIGLSDLLGKTNVHNLMEVARPDGVICKPDAPIVPIDAMYAGDADSGKSKPPMVAAAYTDHGPLRTAYVFVFPRSDAPAELRICPTDLGITGDAWVVYTASSDGDIAEDGNLVAAGQSFRFSLKSPQPNKQWSYLVVAPVTRSGIALVGDGDKFVTAARQRIAELAQTPRGVAATISFAPGEDHVGLFGFAPAAPRAAASTGQCGPVTYDATSKRFFVHVMPGPTGTARVEFTAG